MPGIAGILSFDSAERCHARLVTMLEAMQSGRKNQIGTNHAAELGLFTGWSYSDDTPHSPSFDHNDDQSVSVLLSGECDPAGRSFLDRYQTDGTSIFEHLNGLYSGVVIDRRQKQAFLFNDRFCAERIYFHESNNALYFASEAKALLAALPELRRFDPDGLAQFMTYGCTLNGDTLFSGIKLLPAGSVWKIENAAWTKNSAFDPSKWENQDQLPAKDFAVIFRETFQRILPRYFSGKHPTGISLTGGLDSRMILACLPENIPAPICYTYAAEDETLDTLLAGRVAAQCGLEHQIFQLESNFFAHFAEHAERTVFATDGCAGILESHEIYLSRQAREISPVRLTGNYGSEILRNTSTFKPLNLDPQILSPDILQSVQSHQQRLADAAESPVRFALLKEIPWRLAGTRLANRPWLSFRTPYLDNELCALAFRAPDEILHSPQATLEIIAQSNPALAAIPTNKGLLINGSGPSYRFRRTAYTLNAKLDYYCNEGLPDRLSRADPLLYAMKRHSRVFGRHSFLNYRRWFRTSLADYLQEALIDAASCPYFNPRVVRKIAEDHIRGRKNRLREINAVLTLHAVDRLLLHNNKKGAS